MRGSYWEMPWLRYGDSTGTQKKGNVCHRKPLPKDWWWLSVCCNELQSVWNSNSARANYSYKLKEVSKFDTNPNPIYGQSYTWQHITKSSISHFTPCIQNKIIVLALSWWIKIILLLHQHSDTQISEKYAFLELFQWQQELKHGKLLHV